METTGSLKFFNKIISKDCIKMSNGYLYFLQHVTFGAYDVSLGEEYSNNAFLLIRINMDKKEFRVGVAIGNGDTPMNPFPNCLTKNDSLIFAQTFCKNKPCNIKFELKDSSDAEEFEEFLKQIDDKYSPLIVRTPWEDILPEEYEVFMNTSEDDFEEQPPQYLGLEIDTVRTMIYCDIGGTTKDLFKDKNFKQVLSCLIQLGYNS